MNLVDNSILIDLMEAVSEQDVEENLSSYIDQAVQTSLNQTAGVAPQNLITHSDTIPMGTRMLDFSSWWEPFFEKMTSSNGSSLNLLKIGFLSFNLYFKSLFSKSIFS